MEFGEMKIGVRVLWGILRKRHSIDVGHVERGHPLGCSTERARLHLSD